MVHEQNVYGSPATYFVKLLKGPVSPAGKALEQFDIIITTFQTLASEFDAYTKSAKPEMSDSDSDATTGPRFGSETLKKRAKAKTAGHALFDVKWLRVVLGQIILVGV